MLALIVLISVIDVCQVVGLCVVLVGLKGGARAIPLHAVYGMGEIVDRDSMKNWGLPVRTF